MRQGIIRLAMLVLVSVLTVSCYKDLSTEATQTLSDIEITSELERFDVYYGDTFTFTPEVKIKGRKASDIEYKWEMTLRPNGSDYELELGTDKTLSFFVGNSPASSPYIIRLTVTDKETGLVRSKCWNTYVSSQLGEGILVAHTDDGGKTSELSLIKSKYVTAGYTSSPRIVHNLFATSNGGPIQGKVTALAPVARSNGAVYNLNHVYIGTETDLLAVNYLDYKEDEKNATLFNFQEGKEHVSVEHIFCYGQYGIGLLTNGDFYNFMSHNSYLFSPVKYFGEPSDIFTKKMIAAAKSSFGAIFMVDVNAGKFFYMNGRLNGAITEMMDVKATYSLKGAEAMACGIMKQDKVGFVLKASDGTYYATVITSDGLISSNTDYNLSEISSDIKDAKGFAFCDNTDFFYYYNDREIKVVKTVGKNVTISKITWSPDTKTEKITGMCHYHQGWYGTQNITGEYEHTIDTHRLQVVITTYDETTGEGRIYLRPFNLTTGLFARESNGVYEGFNEITAITTTFR